MAFSTYQPLAVYIANGVQTDFAASDKFYDLSDIRCVLVIGGREYPQVRGVDYAVLVTGQDLLPPYRYEGFLRFTVPPANGAAVVPFIQPQANQDQPFEGRPVTPRQHERVHDRAVMSLAILQAFLDRGYRSPLNAAPGLRTIVTGREGYVPTWDEFGNLIEGPTVGQIGQIVDIIPQINAVAAIAPQVVAVAAIDTEVAGLYPVRAEIAALGPVAGQIATLAPFTDELQDLAPIAAEIYAVGQVPGQVVIVANNIDQVVIAANNITSINTAATNIAAIIAAPAAAAAADQAKTDAVAAKVAAEAAAASVSLAQVAVGSPFAFPTATLRPGYLYMDGSTFNQATYPQLYAALGNTNVLPDWRDRVARGNGTLAGAVGTFQADAFQGHLHDIYTDNSTNKVTGTGGLYAATVDAALPDKSSAPVTDGTNGTPRTATETRVKAAIVSWQIKAYGAITDPGTLDLVALEQSIANAVLKTPQIMTQAQKGQVAANIGQAWEQIGAEIVISTAAAQVDWSNLGAYRSLRLTAFLLPSGGGGFPQLAVGAGSPDVATGAYQRQQTGFVGTAMATVNALGTGLNFSTVAEGRPIHVEVIIDAFNAGAVATFFHSRAVAGSAASVASYEIDGTHSVTQAENVLRVFYSSGVLIAPGSRVLLEGMRG